MAARGLEEGRLQGDTQHLGGGRGGDRQPGGGGGPPRGHPPVGGGGGGRGGAKGGGGGGGDWGPGEAAEQEATGTAKPLEGPAQKL